MTSTNDTMRPDWRGRLAAGDGLSRPVALLLLVGFVFVPLLPGKFWIIVATEILILGLFAMSFNLLHGFMGQISFGHAAFFGLGAYATGLLMRFFKGTGVADLGYFEFLFSLLAGPPVAALGAFVVGFFCIRLTGIYFAILTLAFGELLYYVVFSWYSFTKGDDGVQGLLPPAFFQDSVNFYYFTLLVVALSVCLMWRIVSSPFGYILRAIRDNQRRTAFLGINVRAHMLANFVIAGAFAGVAGALWGPFQRSIAPGLLGWEQSGIAVFMALIGGAKFFIGPMLGSIVYTFLHAWVTIYTVYWPLTIGLIILAIVIFAPGGLLGVVKQQLVGRAKRRDSSEQAALAARETGAAQ